LINVPAIDFYLRHKDSGEALVSRPKNLSKRCRPFTRVDFSGSAKSRPYQAARAIPQNGQNSVIERLKKLTTDNPDFLKAPGFRIAFSYFALLGGDFQLANR